MKLRLHLAAYACAAVFGFAGPVVMAGPGTVAVRLVGTEKIEPTSTFEVRFNEAMVAPEKVGAAGQPAPLVFQPAIKGAFVWLSQHSGSFKPEEPLSLGTTYTATLAPGLAKADGHPLVANFHETFKTPPMVIKGWNTPRSIDPQNATARPGYGLLFNANVDAAAASEFIHFVSAKGESLPAKVVNVNPTKGEQLVPTWRSNDGSLLTWREQGHVKEGPKNMIGASSARGEGANVLSVSPQRPLGLGVWKLVVKSGIPTTEGPARTSEPLELEIGTVRPFEVHEALTTNTLGEGRRLTVSFSKQLGTEAIGKNVAQWVRVEPEPAHLAVKGDNGGYVLTGDFELNKDYRVTVHAGVPSAEPFTLGKDFRKTVRFGEIAPRLYLEGFATHQLKTGSRQFHMLAINVPKIRITARVVTTDAALRGLEAYENYLNPPDDEKHPLKDGEMYDKVALDRLPGTTWTREIEGTKHVDEKREIVLDWNEIIGANQSGIVLLTAEQASKPATPKERPGVQAIVQVTDVGAVWKESKDETFVHVFSLTSGEALAGAKLRALDDKGKVIAEEKTDAGGVARLKTPERAHWLLAANGPDTHLIDFRNQRESLGLYRLGISEVGWSEGGFGPGRQAMLFTERPVYKPGDTVHLKGIVRDWRPDHARIPAGAKATLRLLDPQDRHLAERAVTLSDAGSFSEDFQLTGSALGIYRLELLMPESRAEVDAIETQTFEVQEYTPNAFEITIPEPPKTVGPLKMDLPVTAQYYMGKALSRAQLAWSLEASDETFRPDGFEAFEFCNAVRDYRLGEKLGRNGHFSDQGKVELNAKGEARVPATIPLNAKAPQPRSAHLLCEITDLDQQTVSRSSEFTLHSSDFYLGIRRASDMLHEGDTLPVDVIAVRTDGTPALKPVKVLVRLSRIDWQTNHVETAGNASEYRNEPRFEVIATREIQTRSLVGGENKWKLSPEEKGASFPVGKPGEYLLEATSEDAEGHKVATTTSFNVWGAGQTGWNYSNPFQIELAADKEEYRAGQTAKVLVKTPIAGEALVTIEREKVLRSFVTHLQGNAPVIEVPLQESDAPNVFVSVMMLRGAANSPKKYRAPEYRVGYCKLKLGRPDAKLTVYVKSDAPSYRPGDPVSVSAEVLDVNGRAVANAEVTLYAVDEGVLSLMGYKTPDPLTFFNQERALAVTTGLTLPTLLPEDPGQRTFGNKGYLVGGGGEESGEALRKDFLACALWQGSLRSDATGYVAARFAAPDSLTRYRLIAVVQTARDQFGSADSAFEVNKPLMLEPALPRFANVGDTILLRGVLHNLTDTDGEVEVHVDLDRTVSSSVEKRQVKLPARGSVAVDIPVDFTQAGQAVWKWTAVFTGQGVKYQDAVRTTLKVGYPVPLKREMRVTEMHGNETNLLANVSPELLEGTGALQVSLTNSRAIELRESLDSVLHYPYGCVEQTTSNMLPWIALRDFHGVLPSLQKSNAEINDAVNKGIDRLLAMQTSSGGLSYWPGQEEPMLWGSAYGALGMAMAQRAGFQVPQDSFDRLMQYLSEQLRGTGGDRTDPHAGMNGFSDRCLALYALAVAVHAQPAYHELLYKKRDKLTAENRALLAMAIAESHGPASMVGELLKPRPEKPLPEDDYFWSPSRATAMRLLAWEKCQPKSANVEKLATQLMSERVAGHWSTTQGNCWSLLALADYFRRVEKPDNDITGTLAWNGQTEPVAVNPKASVNVFRFPLAKDGGGKPMPFVNPWKKRVFAEVLVESRPSSIVQPRQDRGYFIERHYAKVEDDGTLQELKTPRIGDRVLVTLDVKVHRSAHYVAVDDPLPAIFEAVNPVFKSQETLAGQSLGAEWMGSHQELREDRALFFADELDTGEYTIRYLARVRAAGTATAPSAKIEEMYHPERFGMTETMQLTSLPLK